MNLDPFINDFAIRSFRDTADEDYIAARMCWRAQLIPPFLWSTLQGIQDAMGLRKLMGPSLFGHEFRLEPIGNPILRVGGKGGYLGKDICERPSHAPRILPGDGRTNRCRLAIPPQKLRVEPRR